MKTLTKIVIIGTCCAALLALWLGYSYASSRLAAREKAIRAHETAAVAYLALYSFRSHGAEYMLSGMEGTLDHSVVNLSNSQQYLSKDELRSVRALLDTICVYRKKYPREKRQESGILSVEEAADEILSSMVPKSSGEIGSECQAKGSDDF